MLIYFNFVYYTEVLNQGHTDKPKLEGIISRPLLEEL